MDEAGLDHEEIARLVAQVHLVEHSDHAVVAAAQVIGQLGELLPIHPAVSAHGSGEGAVAGGRRLPAGQSPVRGPGLVDPLETVEGALVRQAQAAA